jgi:polyribonucleotide nucleotidyltransferase
VSSRKFAQEIKIKIKAEVYTTELDKEIKELKVQLRKCYNRKEVINDDKLRNIRHFINMYRSRFQELDEYLRKSHISKLFCRRIFPFQ